MTLTLPRSFVRTTPAWQPAIVPACAMQVADVVHGFAMQLDSDVANLHYGRARKTSRHVGSQRPTTSAQPTGFGPVEP
jgi:hypothetical protein